MTHTITVRDVGHVTEIVFSNPPNNHANVALLREIGETLLKLDDTPECRAIVLASEGKAFCAGADLANDERGGGVGGSGDFRIAAPEARFVANFTRLAFHPGFALSATLPRLLGPQKASLMLLTSRRIKGEEAVAMGLADELAPLAEVRNAAHRLAAEIAEGGPLGVLATRQTLREGLYETVRDTLAHEHEEQWKLRATEDHKEGIKSVFERRPGNFKGR